MNDLTQILLAAQNGEPRAAEQLLPLVYEELRKLAAAKLARERPGQTLQPTALVHEAWLSVSGPDQPTWNGRSHFFGAAAEAMRRILIDQARRKLRHRHGGDLTRVDADTPGLDLVAPSAADEELLAVHETLDRLAVLDARKAELVKLRYFAGLTLEETADALGISVPTAKRDWAYARGWLHREINAPHR